MFLHKVTQQSQDQCQVLLYSLPSQKPLISPLKDQPRLLSLSACEGLGKKWNRA